jgi:hypothetical protein
VKEITMLRKLALVTTVLLLIGGCFGVDPNVSNLLSAGAKLASNPSDPPIGELTSGELIAITANLPQLAAQFPPLGIPIDESFPTLSEQQAQDAVGFLAQYNIKTVSQLQKLLVDVAEGKMDVEVPESLIQFAASLGFETDAARLISVE